MSNGKDDHSKEICVGKEIIVAKIFYHYGVNGMVLHVAKKN